MVLFWIWYGVAAIAFLSQPDRLTAIAPLSLSLIWWLVLSYRRSLQGLASKLPFPVWVKFLVIGLFFTDVVMNNLAVSFKGDFHPNLFLNGILWLGAWVGVLLGWWLLAQFYHLTAWQVFFVYGIKGVIVEQDFLVPLTIWSGQLVNAFLVIPYLIVVYGAGIAPVFAILEKELPRPERRLNWVGVLLAVVVPMVSFYAGAFVWFKLMEELFGLKGIAP
jgi:hypothetical protein